MVACHYASGSKRQGGKHVGRPTSRIRKVLQIGGAALLLLVAACASGTGQTVTVRVDYDHDEFATQFIRYFPDRIQVHPGDTVNFLQDWTGEAHTVTFGTKVDEVLSITKPLYAEYGDLPIEQVPPDVLEAYFAAECSLPVLYSMCEGPPSADAPAEEAPAEGDSGEVNQTIAQPCLIEDGSVPDDGLACETQELGPFQGTEVYYNSGFIPFEGDGKNVFELSVSDSIAPGEYNFLCSVHGSVQSGIMEVVAADQPIPSPEEVNVETRQQLNEVVEPFRQAYAEAQAGAFVYQDETFRGPFTGLVDQRVDGLLNVFVPQTIEVKVGEPVTWLMFGPHSISFEVPEYFPIYETLEDGTIRANEAVYLPAGGAPEIGETQGPEPIVVDGGTYDGSGFWSSGVLFSESHVEYTLRFSNPGTYRIACLIHPPMVGTVNVTG
jgi:plastocyanin